MEVVEKNEEEVKQNGEKLKLKEGKYSVLGGVPKGLPAMVKANRIQDKVAGVGFDWDEKQQVWDKVEEELREFKEEYNIEKDQEIDKAKAQEEFGDLMFSLINYARFVDINPEEALERTNKKFIKRFNYLEKQTIKKGKSLKGMSLDEMNLVWEAAKKYD